MSSAQLRQSEHGGRIERCAKCGQALPLRWPTPGARSRLWNCTGCRTPYDAVLDREVSLELIQHVQPAEIDFGRRDFLHVPETIAEFIARWFCEEGYEGPERRTSRRHRVTTPVVALPIDQGFEPLGDPFMVMSRSISGTGMALVSTRAVTTGFLAVELSTALGKRMQLVMRVLRCRPIHRFYEIGGKFLTKAGP